MIRRCRSSSIRSTALPALILGNVILACAPLVPVRTADPPSREISGTLPRSIDYYLANGREFGAFVAGLYFGGGTTADTMAACTSAACTVADARTTLTIDGLPDLFEFAPPTAGSNGTIVARITNMGVHRDVRFRARSAGPDSVRHFIVVHRAAGPAAAWELLSYNPRTEQVERTGARGIFRPCEPRHRPRPWQLPVARFGGCRHDGTYGSAGPIPGVGPAPFIQPADMQVMGDGWVACSYGCCDTSVTAW